MRRCGKCGYKSMHVVGSENEAELFVPKEVDSIEVFNWPKFAIVFGIGFFLLGVIAILVLK